jgi:hypothetical protein
MDLIAIRTYQIDTPHVARDYLYRTEQGPFVLRETSNSPFHQLKEETFSIERAFAWLREIPSQIEVIDVSGRDVIGTASSLDVGSREAKS